MTSPSSDWSSFEKAIGEAATEDDLATIEHDLFGRKNGLLTLAMQDLRDLPAEQRKERARNLNEWKRKLTIAIGMRRETITTPSAEHLAADDTLDTTLSLPQRDRGHLHPIPQFIRRVEEVFGRMGFDTYKTVEVDSESFNFDYLNIPETHPARDSQDTFWLKDIPPVKEFTEDGKSGGFTEEERYVLRTHTSPGQIRYMRSHKPPFRAIFPGKCYRKDADATHSPMFHQFEGLMIGKDIAVTHLMGVLVTALKELISKDITFRFRTGFFPFTEPSLEMDIRWRGDVSKSREGQWLEMGGCGMVHPAVLKHGGIDPTEWQGFAFGFGIERPIMIKHQIPDLRAFYEGDLRFLRQFG